MVFLSVRFFGHFIFQGLTKNFQWPLDFNDDVQHGLGTFHAVFQAFIPTMPTSSHTTSFSKRTPIMSNISPHSLIKRVIEDNRKSIVSSNAYLLNLLFPDMTSESLSTFSLITLPMRSLISINVSLCISISISSLVSPVFLLRTSIGFLIHLFQ